MTASGKASPSGNFWNNGGGSPGRGAAGGGGGGFYPLYSSSYKEDEDEEIKSMTEQDINISEAEEAIESLMETDIVPFLWGPPGIGKSTIVKSIAKKKKWQLIDLRLSLLSPVDLRGLPSINKEENIANWLPPSFLPKHDVKTKGILFLDEINLAPLSVQSAAYQLILDKRVGEYVFPPTWKIIAAGNREIDKANVFKLSAPLANRFVHFSVTADFKTWAEWARGNVRPEIIDFLAMRQSLLLRMPSDTSKEKAFPSPRTWAFLSTILDSKKYKLGSSLGAGLEQVIMGTVGAGVGKEFVAFLTEYDLQVVGQKIEEFKRSGKIDMPKKQSQRYAIIRSILQSELEGDIAPRFFKSFLDQVNEEERETINKFKEKHQNELEAKYKKI